MTTQEFAFQNTFRCNFNSESYKHLDDSVILVSTPNISIGVTQQPAIPRLIKIPGNNVELGELSIDFILDENYTNWITIFNWMNKLQNFSEVLAERDVIDISVHPLSNKYNFNFSFVFEDCFPTNITEISFDTQNEDAVPMNFTVLFTINGIHIDT